VLFRWSPSAPNAVTAFGGAARFDAKAARAEPGPASKPKAAPRWARARFDAEGHAALSAGALRRESTRHAGELEAAPR
jgi:hypothetical protein